MNVVPTGFSPGVVSTHLFISCLFVLQIELKGLDFFFSLSSLPISSTGLIDGPSSIAELPGSLPFWHTRTGGWIWSLVGIPQIYHFGQEGLHNILVIDLLGPSLEDLFDMCGRKFSIKTVCMTARQMVRKNIYIYFFRLPIFIIVMVIHYRLLLLYLLFDNFQSKSTLYLIWDHVYILYVMIHRSHVSRQYTTRTSSTETSNQITSSSDDQVQKPPTSFT